MSLYLCLFKGAEELAGLEVGSYSAFDAFRTFIADHLEDGSPGSRFPTLIRHHDSDGEWTVADCIRLKHEISVLRGEPAQIQGKLDWWRDAEDRPLLASLSALVDQAIQLNQPILFQ